MNSSVAETSAEMSRGLRRPQRDPPPDVLDDRLARPVPLYGEIKDEDAFYAQMIDTKRLVVRLHINRVYGVLLDRPPGT
jgi:hypothetical protein